jgi:hypothetical protein
MIITDYLKALTLLIKQFNNVSYPGELMLDLIAALQESLDGNRDEGRQDVVRKCAEILKCDDSFKLT